MGQGGQAELGELAGRHFAGVIFDLDGTLIDSTPAVLRSWTSWAGEYGLTAADLAGFHGVPSADVVRQLLPESQQQQAIARIDELELADVGDIVVLPGAAQAMLDLAGARTAIATSANRILAQARITAAGLLPPTVIITIDDVKRGKPEPDPFLEAARRLDLDPADCLVVEDAPKGLQAAAQAGCATLAVLTTSAAEDLTQADATIPNLAAIRFTQTPEGQITLTTQSCQN